MPDLFAATTADLEIIRQLIEREKKLLLGKIRAKDADERDVGAPDVHIVKIPPGGLLPLEAGSADPDLAHSTTCDVYRISYDLDLEIYELVAVDNYALEVFNPSFNQVDPPGYLIVSRDRFGRWVCPVGSGSSSNVYFGKLDSDLDSGSTPGNMTIWEDGAATMEILEVVNRTGQTLLTDVLMKATRGVGCTEYLVEPYELDTCTGTAT